MSAPRLWLHCPRCRGVYPRGFRLCPRDSERLSNSFTDPLLGVILDGRLRIEEMIGSGLLGRVYRARNVRIPRDCAIKVASEAAQISGQARQRLLCEAEAGARLDHPNVVAVLDVGELPSEEPYLVLELAAGVSLRAHLADGLPIVAALRIAHQIALGLEHTHQRGLIHRDLTPENVLVDPQGRARIIDFGLALEIEGDPVRWTEAGFVIGTPPYMSPEQAAGERVDPRADLYSLGVLLYQMIVGSLPSDQPGRAAAWRLGELPVDRPVQRLLERLLAHAPAERIGSATAVAGELDALIAVATSAVPAPIDCVDGPSLTTVRWRSSS